MEHQITDVQFCSRTLEATLQYYSKLNIYAVYKEDIIYYLHRTYICNLHTKIQSLAQN